VEQGLPPASMAWVYGPGRRTVLPTFKDRFGLRGAAVTPSLWFAGLAACLGWERTPRTGVIRDITAIGREAVAAIDRYDLVCCHIDAPEDAALQGDWRAKVGAIESIDRHVIGPVVQALEEYGDPAATPKAKGWRILVMTNVATLCAERRHDAAPVPFVMAGAWVRAAVQRPFSEAAGAESDLHIEPGHDLMEYFLRGGLATVGRGRTR
jgi:2,3-bisphosphoglycerate-independent phosphoglycerate mutase